MKHHGSQSWLFGKACRSSQIQNTDQRKRGFTPKLIASIPKQCILMLEAVGAKSHGWMKHTVSYRKSLKAQAKKTPKKTIFRVGSFCGATSRMEQENIQLSTSLTQEANLNQTGNEVWGDIAKGVNSLKILMVIPRAKDPQSKFFFSLCSSLWNLDSNKIDTRFLSN